MIVFDLFCGDGHRFEGWFGSSKDFASQCEGGLVQCPQCGSQDIAKAPMAPAVARKGNQEATGTGSRDEALPVMSGLPSAEAARAIARLAELQADALKSSKWVGDKFAEHSRAMHYGERKAETIHGKATAREARELAEEGVPVAPLPFPVAPPDELN